jgi:2-keto-3-deoxy-6-phosphogluconate aldolase
MGSQLITSEIIKSGDYKALEAKVKEALAIVQQIKA